MFVSMQPESSSVQISQYDNARAKLYAYLDPTWKIRFMALWIVNHICFSWFEREPQDFRIEMSINYLRLNGSEVKWCEMV